MVFNPKTTDLQVASSYAEDGKLYVLVEMSAMQSVGGGNFEPRWTVVADPEIRKIIRVDLCIANNDGFEYPKYTPTNKQMALFKKFVKECR